MPTVPSQFNAKKPKPKPTPKPTPKPAAQQVNYGTVQRWQVDSSKPGGGSWYNNTEPLDSKGRPLPPAQGGVYIPGNKWRPVPKKGK